MRTSPDEGLGYKGGIDLDALERASRLSNFAVLVFGILAAFAAAFALYFGSKVSAAKDADLARFQAQSNAEIAAANSRAAEANARTVEAQLKLKELEDRARPRTLEPRARAALVDWLARNPPSASIRMWSHSLPEID